jgi:hypothetical protein
MGYYTDYEVTKAPYELTPELMSEETGYSFDGDLCIFSSKWYNHDTDMKQISLKFPGEEIHLKGIGEEFPDIWQKVYKDGELIRKYKGVVQFVEEKV